MPPSVYSTTITGTAFLPIHGGGGDMAVVWVWEMNSVVKGGGGEQWEETLWREEEMLEGGERTILSQFGLSEHAILATPCALLPLRPSLPATCRLPVLPACLPFHHYSHCLCLPCYAAAFPSRWSAITVPPSHILLCHYLSSQQPPSLAFLPTTTFTLPATTVIW